MTRWLIHICLVFAVGLAAGPCPAAPAAQADTELLHREFHRSFDTRRITHAWTCYLAKMPDGKSQELCLVFESNLVGQGLGANARLGLLNGYIATSLPAGLTAHGSWGLAYIDPLDGREKPLYSAPLPAIPALVEQSLAGKTSLGLEDYSAASRAFDPAVSVFLPVDHNLRAPSARTLSKSWVVPGQLGGKPLVDFFTAGPQGQLPPLVARLKLRGQPVGADPIKLYVGALSLAAAELEVDRALVPQSALVLPSTREAAGLVPILAYSGEWLSIEDELFWPPLPSAPATQADQGGMTVSMPESSRQDGMEQKASGPTVSAENPSMAKPLSLGTLSPAVADETVELKPIQGSAGQRETAVEFGQARVSQPSTAPGFPGSRPGSTLFYGPGGPDNAAALPGDPLPSLPGLGTMVLVPAGEFLMGTDPDTPYGDADELPQHRVNLPAFYIDKYPVTNRQFGEFTVLAGYEAEGDWQHYSSPATLDMPVRNVSWNDANAYAHWAGKRLPTEAEWEKAARGTDGRLYPWGNDWNADILPRGELSYQALVAPKAKSPYGAVGMVGLLWQWTATPWHEYPFDPSARGEKKILRGGAFSNGRNIVRCANRYFEPPQVALNTFTFRCVKDSP